MKDSKLKALINLLDDPDETVYSRVNQKLLNAGEDVIPLLEARYGIDNNPLMNRRLEKLMENLRDTSFNQGFRKWWEQDGDVDLLKELYYVNNLYYTDTGFEEFNDYVELLKGKIWLELSDNLTGFEAIKVINRHFFVVMEYGVIPVQDIKDSARHFPEQMFLNKKVSPFPFIGLYCLVAKSLDLPVYPVYLPGLLLMAYQNRDIAREAYGDESSTGVLFYINPYDAGSFLGRKALDYVIKQRDINAEENHYRPIDNKIFIHKYLRYLWDLNLFSPENHAFNRLENMLLIIRGEK